MKSRVCTTTGHATATRFQHLWYGIDPLFEKYQDFSPYNYCAGNPVRLVDVDGREIDNDVKQDWDNKYEILRNRISEVESQVTLGKEKLSKLDPSSRKHKNLQREIENDENRLNLLKQKQNDMIAMQNDQSQKYSMRRIQGTVGYISMENNVLVINYVDDDNFFHESTHATQYMMGNIGFVNGANPILGFVFTELPDEFYAYCMEYAYSGTLTPDYSMEKVKEKFYWNNGTKVYPYVNFSNIPIGKDSDAFLLRIAYPNSHGMHGVEPGQGISVGTYINNVRFHP